MTFWDGVNKVFSFVGKLMGEANGKYKETQKDIKKFANQHNRIKTKEDFELACSKASSFAERAALMQIGREKGWVKKDS